MKTFQVYKNFPSGSLLPLFVRHCIMHYALCIMIKSSANSDHHHHRNHHHHRDHHHLKACLLGCNSFRSSSSPSLSAEGHVTFKNKTEKQSKDALVKLIIYQFG